MNCKNCNHEVKETDGRCPDCGQPVGGGQGRGMLIAGRILLAVAFVALLLTLVFFIQTTAENGQDQIIEAVRDFRREKHGAVAFLIAFLSTVGSYLLLMTHDKRYGSPARFAVLSTVVRILAVIEGVLVIAAALIGK